MNLASTLAKLDAEIQARGGTLADDLGLKPGAIPTAAQIDALAARIGVALPPSYVAALRTHGTFSLGANERYAFKLLPLDDVKTAVAAYAEELGCEPDSTTVANERGVEPDVMKAFDGFIVVGTVGHEDFVGFDVRTRAANGECAFSLVVPDDSAFEYFANNPDEPSESLGFDAWVSKHVERALEL